MARCSLPEATAIAQELRCRVVDLGLELAPPDPYSAESRELVQRFRKPPEYRHVNERTVERRLAVIRNHYGVDTTALLAVPGMKRFAGEAWLGSGMELYYWAERNRLEGALPAEAAPTYAGFDLHPVVSPEPHRVIGHCSVPAMATDRWLAILHVGLLTPVYDVVDALVFTVDEGKRQTHALELDGPSKPPPSKARERALGLTVIRFSLEEIRAGVGIGDKLDELRRR